MTSLSTHVLDTERGAPASGVVVSLFTGSEQLANATTNADGRIPDVASSLAPGTYRLVFDVGRYYAGQGRTPPFFERVTLEFTVVASQRHYHVPLLLSAYACTAYRGS